MELVLESTGVLPTVRLLRGGGAAVSGLFFLISCSRRLGYRSFVLGLKVEWGHSGCVVRTSGCGSFVSCFQVNPST